MECEVKELRIWKDGMFMIKDQMLNFRLDVDVETKG